MRYCEHLHDGVVVMCTRRVGCPEQKTCLCSHLCAADERLCCRNVTKPARFGDLEFLRQAEI